MITEYDNILPAPLANAVLASMPSVDWEWFHKYDSPNSLKYGLTNPDRLPFPIKTALQELSLTVSRALSKSDVHTTVFPDFDYHAGGIHIIPPSGYLSRHTDCDYHPCKNWKREGSLVWFGNREWDNDWGGELIIEGDTQSSHYPVFNKAVYFNTPNVFHRVTPVTGPYNRLTLAVFFWREVLMIPRHAMTTANFLDFTNETMLLTEKNNKTIKNQ